MTVARLFAAGLALLLSACGSSGDGAGPSSGWVIHLDPRLADGRSPTAVLAQGEVVVTREFVIRSPATTVEDLAPWTLVNAGVVPTERDGPGVFLRAVDYRPEDGVVHAALELSEPLDASDFDEIELELVNFSTGNATLMWETEEPLAGVAPGSLRADAMTTAGKAPQKVAFPLRGHPGWRGRITRITLYPCWKGGQSYDLRAVRFLRGGFTPGHQPLAEAGVDSGDAGLLGFGSDERRTWPSDSSVPLYDRVRVPRGGLLVVDVGTSGELHAGPLPAHFRVDVAAAGSEDWESRGALDLTPAPSWSPLTVDLADLAGREVDLRFRAWLGEDGGAEAGTGGRLERARLWWGAPLVLGERAADPRPNVLLVTLDTLRTDALGCYGGTPVTPFLDELAREGILFEDAWSACNSTLPSHTSILTGLPVPTHGVLDNASTLAPDVRTLAQVLRAAGYHTAAAVSVEHLQAGWSGLGRGFDQYLEAVPGSPINGALTIAGVRSWLATWHEQGARPFFLWVHLFDPHTPYGPPRAFLARYEERVRAGGGSVPPTRIDPANIGQTRYTHAGEFLEGVNNVAYARFLYEASVAYTDERVRDLVGALRQMGVWERTALVLTADHGESLGEHGVWFGHQMLHPPVMHVPLILRLPGEPQGVRVAARASNADVARTLLAHLGVGGLDAGGVDLLELVRRPPAGERRVWFLHAGRDQAGCRDGDVHYWHNLREYGHLGPKRVQPAGLSYLYRHRADPETLTNLADAEPDLERGYREAMELWLERTSSGENVRARLGAEEEARLRELGYAGDDEDDDAESEGGPR